MSRLATLPVAILLICLLSGCAGLALLSLVFKALAVGALVAQVSDLFKFGHTSTEFTLYFDGYDTGKHPNPDGALNIDGLPTGHHLLTVTETTKTVGFHKHVLIAANHSLSLGSITPIQGGTISGQVRRQVGANRVPLAGVRVAAVSGGGAVISQAVGRLITLPPDNDTDVVIMGFTDSTGHYQLGPASFDQPWVVTAAYPGYLTDAVIAQVSAGNSPDNVDLLLPPDNAAPAPASVQGTVLKKGGGSLPTSLVALNLATPFAPHVDDPRMNALTGVVGPLRDQPWFAWASVATVSSDAAAYNLAAPPGTNDLYAFKFGYRAETTQVTLNSGEVFTADFTLAAR